MKLVAPEKVGFSSQRLARINTKMQAYVDEQKLAGISSLIARRGKVVHFEHVGMADIEAGTPIFMPSETYPVTPDFRILTYQALVD